MLPSLSKLCLHSGPCGDPVSKIDYNDKGVQDPGTRSLQELANEGINLCTICLQPLVGPPEGNPELPSDLERIRSSGSYFHRWCIAKWVVDKDIDPNTKKRIQQTEIDGLLAFRPPEPEPKPQDPSDRFSVEEAYETIDDVANHFTSMQPPSPYYRLGLVGFSAIRENIQNLDDRRLWHMCNFLILAFNSNRWRLVSANRRMRPISEWETKIHLAIVCFRVLHPRIKAMIRHTMDNGRNRYILIRIPDGRTSALEAVVDALSRSERNEALNNRRLLSSFQTEAFQSFIKGQLRTPEQVDKVLRGINVFRQDLDDSERSLVYNAVEFVRAELS